MTGTPVHGSTQIRGAHGCHCCPQTNPVACYAYHAGASSESFCPPSLVRSSAAISGHRTRSALNPDLLLSPWLLQITPGRGGGGVRESQKKSMVSSGRGRHLKGRGTFDHRPFYAPRFTRKRLACSPKAVRFQREATVAGGLSSVPQLFLAHTEGLTRSLTCSATLPSLGRVK